MTVEDEARELLRRKSAAEDEMKAIRREIALAVRARGNHIDVPTAKILGERLKAAQEKVREAKKAIADLSDGASS